MKKGLFINGRQLEDWKNEMNTYEYISELPLDLHQLTEFINFINVANQISTNLLNIENL